MAEVTADFEIWQDGMMVASSTDHDDAMHYVFVYEQDGPVVMYRVIREQWYSTKEEAA